LLISTYYLLLWDIFLSSLSICICFSQILPSIFKHMPFITGRKEFSDFLCVYPGFATVTNDQTNTTPYSLMTGEMLLLYLRSYRALPAVFFFLPPCLFSLSTKFISRYSAFLHQEIEWLNNLISSRCPHLR
jgi:hypothetical protein